MAGRIVVRRDGCDKNVAHCGDSDSDWAELFRSLESCLKRGRRLVDHSIELDPLAQRPLPAMERPLPRDANLTYLSLARGWP